MNTTDQDPFCKHGVRRRPWLRCIHDTHCLLFHILVVLSYLLAFWIYLHPQWAGLTDTYSRLAFICGAAILLGWISGVDVGVNYHNHCHQPIFNHRLANRWLGRAWTVFGGWPDFFWSYAHLRIHHRHLLDTQDWTLPKQHDDGTWENFHVYCLVHWPWRYALHFYQEFRPGLKRPSLTRRALLEGGIFAALWSIPFWVDWQMALGLWVLPHWLANVAVMGPGMYVQHFGQERPGPEHNYRHSTTFVSRFFNRIMFNIGYHAEHHQHPAVHWSVLPDLHQQIKPELIAEQAHVVPFGYYRAGYLVPRDTGEFLKQHPDYLPQADHSRLSSEDKNDES